MRGLVFKFDIMQGRPCNIGLAENAQWEKHTNTAMTTETTARYHCQPSHIQALRPVRARTRTKMFPKTTSFLTLYASLTLAATVAYASPAYPEGTGNSERVAINWTDASSDLGRPGSYGTLAVPLDYTLPQSENNTLTLNILKVNATKAPKLGSVLTNWGGPGLNATYWLTLQARHVLA
jgi:hypothetical protein